MRGYLQGHSSISCRTYPVRVSVVLSPSEIPYPYVLDGAEIELGGRRRRLSRWFPSSELVHIATRLPTARGLSRHTARPLSLFDGPGDRFSVAASNITPARRPSIFSISVLFTN